MKKKEQIKGTKKILPDNEEWFKVLFEFAPDAYYINDLEGKFIAGNLAAEKTLGYRKEELIGKNFLDLNILLPEDLPKAAALLAKNISGQPTGPDELTLIRKDGHQVLVDIKTIPVKIKDRKLVLGIARDISERKEAREALRKIDISQRLAQENETIAEIGRIISSSLNIEEVYDLFAQEAKKLIDFDRIAINIINHKDNTVTIPYVSGLTVQGRQAGDTFPLTSSPNEEVVRTRKSLLFQIKEENEIVARFPSTVPHLKVGLRTSLRVPLIYKNVVVGALGFLSTKPNAYGDQDIKLAESIGYQIAGAIANALLFTKHKQAQEALLKSEEAAKRLARENEIIAEIGRIVSSSLNIDEVYERFAQEAKKLIEFDRITIIIINQQENTLTVLFTWGVPIPGRHHGNVFALNGSVTEKIAETQSSILFQGMDENEILTRYPGLLPNVQTGLKSALFIPLFAKEEVIAGLNFFSKKTNVYKDRDRKLAESIGYQIAGAIANAQLFLEHKRAEEALRKSEMAAQRLAQENAIIAEVGRIIGSTLDTDRVYELFAEEVNKVIPFDWIAITVIDHEKGTFHNAYRLGCDIPGRQLREVVSLVGSFTEEVMHRRSSQLIQTDDGNEVAGRFPKLSPFWQRGFRSFIAVPLISHDQVVGVLHIYSLKSQAYKDADVHLAESIGYQIAGAIANALLFAKHKQAQEALLKSEEAAKLLAQENETIAEIGRIISSSLDIEEVYERFAQEAKKLIELDRLSVNIINQKENTVSALYVWGITVSGRQSEDVFSLTGSATGEVFKTRSSLIVQPESVEELEGRFSTLIPTFRAGLRSMMTVPLISRDEIIGALHFRSKKSKAYTELDLRLAERIGTQIAGAIANALLFAKHKQAQEALLKSEDAAKRLAQENETIAEIGRIISSTLNIDEIYERFAQEVKKLIEFDRISINHINPKENTSTILFTWGTTVSGRQSREFFPLAGSATGEVLKARASLIIQPDDEKDIATRLPAFLPVLKAGLRSTMAVPLISKGEMIAALFFYSKRPKAYTDQDLKLAESIGYQIAGAIANAQLFLDHKRDREALRESEWRFRIAAENASDLIWEWDIGKEVLTWFGHIDEKLGYQPGEFPRTIEAWENVIHPEDHDCVMKALDRHLENQERFREEYRVLRKDGTILYWIDSGTAVYDPGGKPYKMIGSVTDITERKKMEEELLRSKKLESVGFLSGGIAHDFNNLLTGIMGNISLAKLSACPGDKILTYLENAENLSVRSSELTKKLLTFSKGGAPIKKPVLIGDFLKETARMPLSGSNVRCEFKIAEDLWPVEIDEGQMRQVIYNIVINACEAMPGGGTINILAENIIHGPADRPSLKDGKYVKLSIKDQGAGIPPENLSKIFDPYFSTKEMGSQKGMGLGLAISHSIIKNHGGFIVAESIVGNGSTFHIYLPVSSKEFLPAKEVVKKPRLGKVRILVMDDEQVVRYISGEFLKHLGYEVELAEDGAEAVARYKKAQESQQPFDMVILDLIVPGGMGGKEVLEKLLEISPDVQAIVSSGYSNDPIFSDFKRYGFKGVIAKPFDLEGLSESVSKAIKMAP